MSAIIDLNKITYTMFRQMEFDENDPFQYELINGILVKKSAPHIRHQRISKRLLLKFEAFISEKQLGEILYAPLDVYLDEENTPQPDLVFISKERLKIIDETEGIIMGAPDLVLEIISKGSIKRDRKTKKEVYERFGIPEYWLVDQFGGIEIYVLENGVYQLHNWLEEGKVTSKILKGFELDLKDIFK
jgi:Uma2 family endonuclease